ncbi:MAG: hypothetical protein E2O38_08480, partial [Proteobacteria bacterium]
MQRIVRNNASDHQATDRDVGRYDSRDGEGRVAPGAATENNARLHGKDCSQQSFCISTVPGGQMEDDCRDAGGRATQGAVAEVESRLEQRSRSGRFRLLICSFPLA